jgi:translation initiation factor eIF-2B subunit beta
MFQLHIEICIVKVIVGAHAVMANGGVIAPVGLNMVALAAQRHDPFVVLAGSHKVT